MLKLTWNCLRCGLRHLLAGITSTFIIWIDEGLALCLAPMSRSGEREGPRSCTKIMKMFYHVQTNMVERSLLWPTHKTYHSMVIRPGMWLVEGHVTSLATVLTAQSNSSSNSHIAVLSVHVVGATSWVVSQPNPYILNLLRRFVKHLDKWSSHHWTLTTKNCTLCK